ncbi:MAG: phenylalanine--tRNA ligase subunit beta [Flavobacteriaceae bacterium]|nr:phenylalanine--tRNA ligase subunit beta [Flavobacteriaceae bacterium]
MKISYNWLKQFLKIDLEAEKVAEMLTDLGLEVEGIETFESVKGGLKGVVVGKVLSCVKHPNADRLKLTTVDLGNGEPVQIVCGAPNVAEGQMVPVATVGTTLYAEDGKDFMINKGNIRGEVSYGMICAEDELGLGTSHEGIMILDEKLKVGTPAAEVFNVTSDQVFEIGLTPNRADAMSHYGVARDLRAGLLQQGMELELNTPSVSDFQVEERTFRIDVDVEVPKQVPRYAGVTLVDVKIEESPEWLQKRLKSIGLTPINNIVDVTNYVLHELGQPLHAFDAGKIKGNKVRVMNLPESTKFITLDGVERSLHADDIMICDGKGTPMCIGGVFGGLDSGITEDTTSVFLESAYFDPVSIRKTSKRFGLNTDASFRFERGIDPNITEYALKRAALLIEEIAGGKITSDIVDIYPNKIEDRQVQISYERIFNLIGEELSKDDIKNILVSLDIRITNQTETGLGLTIPAYRVDVTREADIVEEILRVYGYNNIHTNEKLSTSVSYKTGIDEDKLQNLTAEHLVGRGFYEMMANSLTNPEYVAYGQLNTEHNVQVLNALSSDLSVMRQTLLFSALEAVAYNNNRKQLNLRLFEFGKTYHQFENGYDEQKHLSLVISGNRNESSWLVPDKKTDFFFLKGMVISILERLGIQKLKTKPLNSQLFSEGISLYNGKKQLVELGVVHTAVLKQFGIRQEVFYADLHWDTILDLLNPDALTVGEIAKFPAVKRDLALLLNEAVTFEEVYNIAFQAERKLLQSVDLFDVYQGDKLPENKKSYAVTFVLQDKSKTLNDKEIDNVMQKLTAAFEKQLNAELRQ